MSTLSTELVILGKGVMRCTYPYRDQRINNSKSGYITSFLQKVMIPTITDFTYIQGRRISRLREEDLYRLTYLHFLVVGGCYCCGEREKVGRNRESRRGCYDKRVCLLKSCENSADPADVPLFSRRFVPRYTYVPSLPKGNLRGRRIDGGGGGVIFWVTPWVILFPTFFFV